MKHTRITWSCLLAAGALATACSAGSDAGVDAGAGADADTEVPFECMKDFGETFVFDSLAFMPGGDGVDLTGDGEPDNLLAPIGAWVNERLEDSITEGSAIYLFDLSNLDGPEVTLDFYLGLDADSPPNKDNNLDGSGEFHLFPEQIDADLTSTGRFDEASITDGLLAASDSEWRVVFPRLGEIPIDGARLTVQISEDGTRLTGGLGGGGFSLCGMQRTPAPGTTTGGTLLEWVYDLGLFEAFDISPDLDLDGDGLETISEQLVDPDTGETYRECREADGTAIGVFPACACAPEIADAYSVSVSFTAVRAEIVGVDGRDCD